MGSLFRPEALDGQRQAWLGGIRLIRPLSLTVLTVIVASAAALMLAYLLVGEYTRTAHLSGVLASSLDMVQPVPVQTGLHVDLVAPASTVKLLRPQQSVRLRYPALPQQDSGHHVGKVLRVSRTPLHRSELAGLAVATPATDAGAPSGGSHAGEALYRVTVALDTQAAGQLQPLAAGMRVEADVMLDRRRLIDWLFEPLRDAARQD